METIQGVVREIVSKGWSSVTYRDFQNLERALQYYDRDRAKHCTVQRIRFLTTVHKKAKYDNGRVFDAEFAKGDTATVIGDNFENIRCVSNDPARVQFSIAHCEQNRLWEYYSSD